MNKTTIETIDGKQYTVVWYLDEPWPMYEWADYITEMPDGCLIGSDQRGDAVYIALTALPRYPGREDEPLLYRYMAEGLFVEGADEYGARIMADDFFEQLCGDIYCTTTHATDTRGKRVEVAIKEASD